MLFFVQTDPILDGAAGALIGAIVVILAAIAARQNGLLQISFMRKTHELNVTKAIPRIGCEVSAQTEQILPTLFAPHTRVIVKIYNEGELAAQKLTGQWELCSHQTDKKIVLQISRDFLGNCDAYVIDYLIPESSDWGRYGFGFDVNIEFFYLIPGDPETHRYEAHYAYESRKKQMIRKDV
jgi:hypothetical protein